MYGNTQKPQKNNNQKTHTLLLSQRSDLFNGQMKYYFKIYTFDLSLNLHISSSSQCSMTGVTKAVVCVILSVG